MPAHNNDFPWLSYYGHYRFFEERMAAHNKVSGIQQVDVGLYDLTRNNGSVIRVFICDCYSFGVAEYHEVTCPRLFGPAIT